MLIIRWILDENNHLKATFVRVSSAAHKSDRLIAGSPPRASLPSLHLAKADIVQDVALTAGMFGSQDDLIRGVTKR